MGLHSEHVSAIRAVGSSRRSFRMAQRVPFVSILIRCKHAGLRTASHHGGTPISPTTGTQALCTADRCRIFEDGESLAQGVTGREERFEGCQIDVPAGRVGQASPEHGRIEVGDIYSRVLRRAFEDGSAVELCCGLLEGVTKLLRP